MSAETLRKAAALMRERAEAATAGPWIERQEHGRDFTDEGWSYVAVSSLPLSIRSDRQWPDVAATAWPGEDGLDEAVENSTHIASWHPAVALAVADWLDELAGYWEDSARFGIEASARHPALTVARTYLGETP